VKEKAVAWGWNDVEIIDCDLGISASTGNKRVSKFATISIATLQATFDRTAQTIVGFNSEATLMNTRFYVAIGAPFAPPAGKSLGQCLEDCLELMTASYQASVAECKEDSFKLAIGIAFDI